MEQHALSGQALVVRRWSTGQRDDDAYVYASWCSKVGAHEMYREGMHVDVSHANRCVELMA